MGAEKEYRFEVALSFAGEDRDLVRKVANLLQSEHGEGKVFFDEMHKAETAGVDAHLVLQDIYSSQSLLVVPCISAVYNKKPWAQDEWRAITALERQLRDAKTGNAHRLRILPLRFGDGQQDGTFSTADIPDVRNDSPEAITLLINQRLKLVRERLNLPSKRGMLAVRSSPDLDLGSRVEEASTLESEPGQTWFRFFRSWIIAIGVAGCIYAYASIQEALPNKPGREPDSPGVELLRYLSPVLWIDDEELDGDILEGLAEKGIETQHARSTSEARVYLTSGTKYLGVISDKRRDGKDDAGVSFLRTIRDYTDSFPVAWGSPRLILFSDCDSGDLEKNPSGILHVDDECQDSGKWLLAALETTQDVSAWNPCPCEDLKEKAREGRVKRTESTVENCAHDWRDVSEPAPQRGVPLGIECTKCGEFESF